MAQDRDNRHGEDWRGDRRGYSGQSSGYGREHGDNDMSHERGSNWSDRLRDEWRSRAPSGYGAGQDETGWRSGEGRWSGYGGSGEGEHSGRSGSSRGEYGGSGGLGYGGMGSDSRSSSYSGGRGMGSGYGDWSEHRGSRDRGGSISGYDQYSGMNSEQGFGGPSYGPSYGPSHRQSQGYGQGSAQGSGQGYGAGYSSGYGGGQGDWRRHGGGRHHGGGRSHEGGRHESWSNSQPGYGGREDERGFWDRASDEVSSWFGDDEAARRREQDHSHHGRGPRNYTRSDDRIREDVCERLTQDPRVDASDIEVQVSGREVTLTGHVDSREARRRAEDCVEMISGVTHVQNNLRVKEHQGAMGSGVATGSPGYTPIGSTSTSSGAGSGAGTSHGTSVGSGVGSSSGVGASSAGATSGLSGTSETETGSAGRSGASNTGSSLSGSGRSSS